MAVEDARSYAELQQRLAQAEGELATTRDELAEAHRQRDDALEREAEGLVRETATAEILRVIASSPTDLQPVLQAVAANAARLCHADNSIIWHLDGDVLRAAAHHGPFPEMRVGESIPILRGSVTGRALLDRQTVHVHDLASESDDEYPFSRTYYRNFGTRTMLSAPMLREGVAIGVIHIRRTEARAFSAKQIRVLETFADQAVIAIENARLLHGLTEALEQQTATSEILRVIASSPTDLQHVLDTVAENAAGLCDANDAQIFRVEGDVVRLAASYGSLSTMSRSEVRPVNRDWVTGRSMVDRCTIHVPDLAAMPETEYPLGRALQQRHGHRTTLATPLLREGSPIGAILIRRLELRPFTDQQIKLLETFADQAVIAIENTRLFGELQQRNRELSEALEQQTATSEILRVIATSPSDLATVLNAIAASASHLCEADHGVVAQSDDAVMRVTASTNPANLGRTVPLDRTSVFGTAMLERRTIQADEPLAEKLRKYPGSTAHKVGFQTQLVTPLLRQGTPIGALALSRRELRSFSTGQIKLLETFADQAVIAIENTRLFQELQERNQQLQESNRQVTEALEQQTATSEILRVISSSPTDLQPVLDAVAENAARLCDAYDAQIFRVEGEFLRKVAAYGSLPSVQTGDALPISRGFMTGRAVVDRQTVHVYDLAAELDGEFPEARERQRQSGQRTTLATPLLREGVPIGVVLIRRLEVRPFTDKQIELLKTFADQAVIAIENTRLFQELQERTRELSRSVEELRALGAVGQAVSSTLDLQRVLTTVVAHAVQLSETDGGAIYEYDEAAEEFHLRATRGFGDEITELLRTAPLKLGEGAMGLAAVRREPVQVPDLLEPGAYGGRLREAMLRSEFRALLAVPLLHEEQVVGGLIARRKTPGEFPSAVVELMQTFASQSALAIQNARLFRELEEKSRQLEEVSRHKSEFLANMSHELRTPLNAIIGFSEVLVERMFGDLNEKQLEYQRDILTSGQHLLSLINDILDLSKVEAGRMEPEPGTFSLREALENGLTMLKERAGRHGISLGLEIADDLDEIAADERKVKQVVFNLLSNAVKFTPDGGRVEVQARCVDDAVQVSVADTGVGIAPEDLDRVFEEFRQVGQRTAKAEGTGLGLALTKKLIELHGGRIWVESQVGSGSTFTFTLPQQAVVHKTEAIP